MKRTNHVDAEKMFDTVEIHNSNVKKQNDNVYNPRAVNPAE